jgi:hypothetical protein
VARVLGLHILLPPQPQRVAMCPAIFVACCTIATAPTVYIRLLELNILVILKQFHKWLGGEREKEKVVKH